MPFFTVHIQRPLLCFLQLGVSRQGRSSGKSWILWTVEHYFCWERLQHCVFYIFPKSACAANAHTVQRNLSEISTQVNCFVLWNLTKMTRIQMFVVLQKWVIECILYKKGVPRGKTVLDCVVNTDKSTSRVTNRPLADLRDCQLRDSVSDENPRPWILVFRRKFKTVNFCVKIEFVKLAVTKFASDLFVWLRVYPLHCGLQ